MKKSLLASAVALLAAGAASGATPETIENFYLQGISPDGRYIVSVKDGELTIKDQQTGQIYDYLGDDMTTDYSVGLGNVFSSNGIMVGSTTYDGDAAYWRDGEWHQIASAAKYPMRFTNAITTDGTMIVGDVSNLDNTLGNDGTMMIPVYWLDNDGDGIYESENLLPWPETDVFGGHPQYVNALSVSADGSVIAGQVVEESGFYIYPILWKKNSEGSYEYSYPGSELFNPNHLDIPTNPGPQPEGPEYQDYMTAEELAAYQAAYNEWMMTWEGDAPEPISYMTPEEAAAYQAAVTAYNDAYTTWYTAWDAYITVFYEIIDASPNYVFNVSLISPNGKYLAGVASKAGETYWDPSMNYTVQLDLETGASKVFPTTQNVSASAIMDDGSMLGTNYFDMMSTTMPTQGYIYKAGADDFVLLYDYFKTADPSVATWMEENLKHDIETIDAEYNPITIEGVLVTGTPLCTPDMSTVTLAVFPYVFWTAEYDYISYVIGGLESGIKETVGDISSSLTLKASKGGVFTLSGDARSLTVYDLNGRTVYTSAQPATVIETGLGSGVYVAKAIDAQGNPVVAKVVF